MIQGEWQYVGEMVKENLDRIRVRTTFISKRLNFDQCTFFLQTQKISTPSCACNLHGCRPWTSLAWTCWRRRPIGLGRGACRLCRSTYMLVPMGTVRSSFTRMFPLACRWEFGAEGYSLKYLTYHPSQLQVNYTINKQIEAILLNQIGKKIKEGAKIVLGYFNSITIRGENSK